MRIQAKTGHRERTKPQGFKQEPIWSQAAATETRTLRPEMPRATEIPAGAHTGPSEGCRLHVGGFLAHRLRGGFLEP